MKRILLNPIAWAWLIPGAGHALLGERRKGLLFFLALVPPFALGFIWADAFDPIAHPLIFLAQAGQGLLAGLFSLVSTIGDETVMSAGAAVGQFNEWLEPATLYTTIPGLLNLLLIADVWGRETRTLGEKPE